MTKIRTKVALAVVASSALTGVATLSAESALALGSGSGSVSLTALGSAYTQDFDTLANTGSASLSINGWFLDESGTSVTTNNGQYQAGTGSGNAGDAYSFGAAAVTERALGGLRSGSLNPTFGATFVNNTGTTVNVLDIAYTGEMWRAGVLNRGAADRLDFQYSTDATSITTGTWTDVNALDFTSPVLATAIGALNGNDNANKTNVAAPINGLNIANGSSVWIRWTDFDISSSDDGLAIDSFSLTPRVGDAAPLVSSTVPVDGATNFPVGSNLSVTFSEPVNVTASTFALTCSVSGTVATTYAGGPTAYTIDPGVTLVDGESCTLTVTAAQVSDVDASDPPDTMALDFTVGFSAVDACLQPFTPIPSIQGSGSSAATTGNLTTRGVVVGDFEGSTSLGGFYLQDPTGDGDPATSDGLFVFTGTADLVSVGQVVRVTGYARERFSQTAINATNANTPVTAAGITNCGTGSVAATDVSMPFSTTTFPERYEGMLVRFPQSLVISEYFNYDRFGEIVLGLPLDGESRPFTPTSIDEPGAAANARALANSLRRITLDDGLSTQNPDVLRHPNGTPFTLANRFRGGDTVQDAVGVMGYDFSLYRIHPTAPAAYTSANPRPAGPDPVGGNIRVAAMNTLNYFLTLDPPSGPLDNKCGPSQTLECRGADSDQADEFSRQRAKLLAALSGLDGDVIGLNELENTPGVDPVGDIASGLGGYAAINTGTIGTDAIKVGLIYRPAKVAPVGTFQILDSSDDPRFIDTKSRPALAQTFRDLTTGSKFTVVVNHLKSKGSDCLDLGDADTGDGQGNCNITRTNAAKALVDWIATDPTGSGDPDFLIMGDLNSYAKEDPIDAVKAGADDTAGTADDFTNLIDKYEGTYAYSYTFDGAAGYLDHSLASAGLVAQVTGATEWHINSDEPDVLDYDTSFKSAGQDALYEPNGYRSSDHDSVVVGINLVNAPPSADAGGPYSVVEGGTVSLAATGSDPEGTAVSFAWDLDDNGSFETAGQNVSFTPTAQAPTVLTVKVQVTDADGKTATDTATVAVLYEFSGFFGSVSNPPATNTVNSGQTIPVKFSLSGDHGLNIFAAGSPTVELVACGSPTGTVLSTVTAGGSTLSYDATTDQYTYTWKTDKAWAGKCAVLKLTFNDGTVKTALFTFRK